MPKRTNKDVLATDWKFERLALIKTLRAYAKENKTNQFEMALKLLCGLYRAFQVYKHFIADKELVVEFATYFNSMEANYDELFQTVSRFEGEIADKLLPKFGA